MDYKEFYDKLSGTFRSYAKGINVLNKVFTWIMYVLYPSLLIYLLIKKNALIWKIVLVPAISFIVLTIIRDRINVARPYETYAIDPIIKKNKKDHSFPSRHVFSSFIISMAFFKINRIAGIILFIISGLEAMIRVIGGVHYPRDVIAGMIVGIVCGLLM